MLMLLNIVTLSLPPINISVSACIIQSRNSHSNLGWRKFSLVKERNKGYWETLSNRRKFFEELKLKYDIQTPSDWGKITTRDIYKVGGGNLLKRYYKGSLFWCLKSIYSEIEWKQEWFPSIQLKRWENATERKKFFDSLQLSLNIQKPIDWAKLTRRDISRLGGASILKKYYRGSLFECLQSLYPGQTWKREWFTLRRWEKFSETRKFLEELKHQFNIKRPSDWGNISRERFYKAGGASLLLNYYNGSLFTCLQSIYPEIEWKIEWFRVNQSWKSISQRRAFLEKVKIRFQIVEQSDWGKITVQDVLNEGGRGLLNHYNNSLFECLKAIFPETEWKIEWFPSVPMNSWEQISDRKRFLERIKNKFNIQNPSDWAKITTAEISKAGGSALVNRYYKGSLFECLKSLYPEIEWKKEWFPITKLKFPRTFWNSLQNCRNFLDQIASVYNIKTTRDWSRITCSLVRNRGGYGLLSKYGNSMHTVLNSVFPSENWIPWESAPQQRLLNAVHL